MKWGKKKKKHMASSVFEFTTSGFLINKPRFVITIPGSVLLE